MIGDTAAILSAISSLIGTVTVAGLAIGSWRNSRRRERAEARAIASRQRLERKTDAVARTAATTAATVATVGAKVDVNTELTESIHSEVVSANGITGTELLERAEGRRINEIPEEDRTPSEQGYSDRLAEQGRNMGHDDVPSSDPATVRSSE